ncbi:glycoside hydrolase family 92 protein [Mariniphaga sediminis]|uniref:Glycoside hydrolase family 92 protein n=1 Tax=Mariniphaga sediminis TaxID=1628158 RepID=A0A399D1P2_9BACT|nr:glycoside hydrolase domain-containing protein [Mariniphaga sediminis]RIH65569.1 glycoside hydrolase family 92 protein [Mariniphaga sediminis]
MRKILIATLSILLSASASFSKSVADYVDLFICTAGDNGQLDPAACVPFGMVKLGPDTNPQNHSGYDFNAKEITGFSHNRIGGVGCNGAGGNLRFLPGIGNMNIQGTPLKKETEKASPCYYSVEFSNNIIAELTATNQTGIHKYTYPETDEAFVIVDIGSSFAELVSSSYEPISAQEFNVTVSAKNVCNRGQYTVHYHVWSNKKLNLAKQEGNKLYFEFETKPKKETLFYVTTSTISTGHAKAEWENVTKNTTFEQARLSGYNQWEDLLSRIIVEGKEEYKTLFYTHLYHIFLNPVKTENYLKEFKATDGKVYKSDHYDHYDSWSMWDNFRNKFSLYSLIIPDISSDVAYSLIDLYKYGKYPWSGNNEPVPTVRTEHTIITLLDLYQRGIDFKVDNQTYRKMAEEIETIQSHSPDQKLEQSYDFWALAKFADLTGKADDSRRYMQKSQEYKKIWKEKFLPITEKSDIMHGDGLYEGTLWQYRWHVQFDVDGIIEMIGSKEKYAEQLEFFFDNHLYNHGNQPDIHVPFMFNFGTKPWLTQKWTNKILTKSMIQYYGTHDKWPEPYRGRIYKAEPAGYFPEMDDDEGTMSGWYVLASMGFYPVLVGEPVFQLSTPIFEKITIRLPHNKKFTIEVKGLSDQNFYIDTVELNGQPFSKSNISHKDIIDGGTLTFNVSDTPNKKFGR